MNSLLVISILLRSLQIFALLALTIRIARPTALITLAVLFHAKGLRAVTDFVVGRNIVSESSGIFVLSSDNN